MLEDGSLSNDRVALADFIPNNWSAWPTTYVNVEIITETPEEVSIRVTRDFSDVTISSVYTLKSGSDLIQVTTTMENGGEDLTDLLSGYVLWADGGFKFAIPGYAGQDEAVVENPIADRYVAYDAEWAVGLHAPYFTEFRYKSRDLYMKHSLANGETATFEGAFQVIGSGNISDVLRAEIARKEMDSGSLSGTVAASDGELVDSPSVIVHKDGVPYIWDIGEGGNYSLDLPVGDYEVYASGKGYSQSEPQQVTIASGEDLNVNFEGLLPPGNVSLSVLDTERQTPVDARIQIAEGNQPLIEFHGSKTFFTELDPAGTAHFELAPGDYKLRIASGENFLSQPTLTDITISPAETTEAAVNVDIGTHPTEHGWYSADLHHHSNVLEGSTPPEYLVRSQLAAGLTVTFVSDHDSGANHAEIKELSDSRGVTFIPSMEISASWAHFNPYPLDIGASLSVDPGVDTIHAIMEDAKRMGAENFSSNHPYIPYGYLKSLENGVAPGGFNPGVDTFEVNSEVKYMELVEKVRTFWTQGLPYYYSAGSDTHDVWNENSGENRMFVHTVGQPTPDGFAQNQRNGHSYVSFGPIIYTHDVIFGETLKLFEAMPQKVSFDLVSVNGLKSVQLLGKDGVITEQALDGDEQTVEFDVPHGDGWLGLVVEDSLENKAFSNPIWLKVVEETQFKSANAE